MTRRLFSFVAFTVFLIFGFGIFSPKDPEPQKIDATGIPSSREILKDQVSSVHDREQQMSINSVWTESFDNTTFPPTGWLNIQESGSGLWTRATSTSYPSGYNPHSGAGMARFNSYTYTTGVSASLISAVFSLTAGQGKLSFWMLRDGVSYQTNADRVDFMVNTSPSSSGATLLGTIHRSKSLAPVETGSDGWYYYEFTIPASFNTSTNYIILKATSAYGNDCYVDDVAVDLLLANNVGVQSVDVNSPQPPGTIVPKATVKNYGTATQTFPVTMSITPGSYTSTKNVTSLASGNTYQVSFDNWVPTNGSYSVKVITQLSNDQDRSNDTLIKPVTITSASWSTGAPITAGSYLGSGVGYTRPGNDTTFLFACGGNSPNYTALYKYNVMTNSWSSSASMPGQRVVLATAIVGDTLYAIGGSNGSSYYNTLYKYNINSNSWTTGTPIPTSALGWCKAAAYQDSLIYVAGGTDGVNYLTTVYLYNAISGTWRTASPLTTGCFGGGFAVAGNYVVYVGGIQGSVPGSNTYKGAISQTDRSQITWTTGAAYPGGTMWKTDAATWWSNTIIMTTGTTGTTSTTWWTPASPNPCYIYNPASNTWESRANLTTPVLGAYLGSVQVGTQTRKLIVASGYNGSSALTNTQVYTETLEGIKNISSEVPDNYSLGQNYPNPFNPSTKITFDLKSKGFVTLTVYNILGKEVSTLVNEYKNAGSYSVDFNASSFASGVYFYRIQTGDFTDTKKMMLIK
jgi:N-acetylneuraminic acid mutarotase